MISKIAVVAVRLFALYLTVNGISRLLSLINFAVPGLPIERTALQSMLYTSAIPGVVQLAAGILCWAVSASIVRLILHDKGGSDSEALDFPARDGVAAAGLFVVGIAVAALSLPGLAVAMYSLWRPPIEGYELSIYQRNQHQAAVLGELARLAVGIVLAWGARRWVERWSA